MQSFWFKVTGESTRREKEVMLCGKRYTVANGDRGNGCT